MTTGSRSASRAATIWTGGFLSLVVVTFLAFVTNMALLPVIPLYVAHLGGDELMAGVVLTVFSVASFMLRPRIGRIVDRWDAGWIALLGCLLLAAATVGMLVPALVFVLLANVVRGIGWAAMNTGTHVLLAKLAPLERRGEAAGYFSLATAAAGLVGPAVALFFLGRGGSFTVVLLVCGGCAAAAALIARPLRQAGRPTRAAILGRRQAGGGGVIARSAVLPAVLVVLVMATQPAVLAFVPLYAEHSGISTAAVTVFYLVGGVCALLARAIGRLSDRLGRGILILGGFLLLTGSLVALLLADSAGPLVVAGGLYAVGQGMALPALTAVAIDRAEQTQVGLVMATYSASYQVGLGAGGLLAGVLISGVGYQGMYLALAVVCVTGVVFTSLRWSALR